MMDLSKYEKSMIDLGAASAETKGEAGVDIDLSGGRLNFLGGALAD